ncbi:MULTISPECIES: Rop family plasmid primer RNA-binding protein [unclassified Aeromonas]|uniref:Rop family plasmid primer RNA-binding protein n=1 Tax=unclassified Aeromonas TaxID=257493 RepID=UPI0022E486D5|nr:MULTISPECIES: Rop family plasmid primer RNA-binding protein [unclassified Aeromonas]
MAKKTPEQAIINQSRFLKAELIRLLEKVDAMNNPALDEVADKVQAMHEQADDLLADLQAILGKQEEAA